MTVAASRRPSEFTTAALSILVGASVMLSLSMGMRQSLGLFMGQITRDAMSG